MNSLEKMLMDKYTNGDYSKMKVDVVDGLKEVKVSLADFKEEYKANLEKSLKGLNRIEENYSKQLPEEKEQIQQAAQELLMEGLKMAKKDFSKVKTNSVYDTIAEATATPEQEETQENANTQDTQDVQEEQEAQILQVDEIVNAVLDRQAGKRREGKAKRINMAFTDDNYNYINVMARIKGQTLTDFLNEIVTQSREKNSSVYKKAVELLKDLDL